MNIDDVTIDGAAPDQESAPMRAAVLEEVGGPFVVRTLRRPRPGPGEVLVRVAASGVNPLDTKIRSGAAAHAQVATPAVLGIDVAGVVEGLGEDVTGLHVGQEVFGLTGGIGSTPGSLAQYQAVDARLLAPKPARLSMLEAAALPLAFVTVYEALVDRAHVGTGQKVLVQGAAGGVGHIGVQLAKALGAQVYGTASATDLDLVHRFGAEPIDFRTVPVEQYVRECTGGLGFDVVLDTVGGATLDASFTAVRRYSGHVVSILGWGTHNLAPLSFRGATYSGVFSLLPLLTGEGREHHGQILRYGADLVDRGVLTPQLHERSFTLETVAQAHDAVTSPDSQGKVVVQVT